MSIYNLKGSNTRRIRAALANARTDQGLARIVFPGDSATAGFGTTRGQHDPVTRFRKQLERRGFTVGEILGFFNPNLAEPRLSKTGTTSDQGGNSAWVNTFRGGTRTYTGVGRFLEIVGSHQSRPWSYTVDGGTPVQVSPNGAAQYCPILHDTGVEGQHTVVITQGGDPADTGAWGYYYSVGFRPAKGIVLQNMGLSGSTAYNHIGNATLGDVNVVASTLLPPVDAAIVELSGMNEMLGGYTAANWQPHITAIVDKFQSRDTDVFLVATQQTHDLPIETYQPFLDALYALADSKNVPLLDLTDEFGWGTSGDDNPGGHDMSTDGAHLTLVGNDAKAVLYTKLLDIGMGPLV